MISRNPPKLAHFLVSHLARGRYLESLQGDLMEEWQAGRSSFWYWRQVLIAIALTAWQGLRAIAFPVALAVAVLFGVSAAAEVPTHSVIGWARSLEHHTALALNGHYYSTLAAKLLRSGVILMWLCLPLLVQGFAIQALWGRRARATALISGVLFFMLPHIGGRFTDVAGIVVPMLNVIVLLLGTIIASKLSLSDSKPAGERSF